MLPHLTVPLKTGATYGPHSDLFEVTNELWTEHKHRVGLVIPAPPHVVKL